tara:strand:- start:2067 stop:3359 length:1293 start_codon:yes stop_codon:yes gene_type:complete
MPTYAEIPTIMEGDQERFVTDDRPVDVTDNVTRRMMHPTDCLNRLNRIANGRQDLLVEGGEHLGLQIDPSSDSLFSIAPDIDAGLGLHVREHGPIPMSNRAVNQLAGLMDAKGGYSRYQKMGEHGPRHFLADFASFFRARRSDDFNLMFRTNDSGTGRIVEGVMRDDIDRTDSNIFVANAMRAIMERFGDIIRGVEMFESNSQGGMEFRILFGNPIMIESEREPTKRLYTMLNLSTSDVRAFMPRASIGVWRMWCANGCTDQDFAFGSFQMRRSTTFEDVKASLDSMASIAFPFAGLIATSLQALQHRQIGDGEKSAFDVLGIIRDRGDINEEFYERCHDLGKNAYGDDELATEWDVFNLMTDAAKGLGSMAARRNAEDKALTFAMYDGGITGVADHGFNRTAFETSMAARVNEFVLPHRQTERDLTLLN